MFISRIFALPYLATGLQRSVYVSALRLCFITVLLSIIGCGISNDKLIEQYNDFAIRSAQADLWNEAILRWQRIIGAPLI